MPCPSETVPFQLELWVNSHEVLMDTGVAVVLVAVSGVLGDSPGTFRSCMAKSCKTILDQFYRHVCFECANSEVHCAQVLGMSLDHRGM